MNTHTAFLISFPLFIIYVGEATTDMPGALFFWPLALASTISLPVLFLICRIGTPRRFSISYFDDFLSTIFIISIFRRLHVSLPILWAEVLGRFISALFILTICFRFSHILNCPASQKALQRFLRFRIGFSATYYIPTMSLFLPPMRLRWDWACTKWFKNSNAYRHTISYFLVRSKAFIWNATASPMIILMRQYSRHH